ncbi:hypothetical protein ARMGADRAFT_1035975 [Armillaria gallica]|uniref:Uncharacterized protein n=1 Tax=Armillaria gallica TaxID=47427 RepID=A0A2H3DCM6_ARMGA|nr:hypothetical protein ARMGADRAFT_1035975 [Armillaria gallica]
MYPNKRQMEYIHHTMSVDGKLTDEAGVQIAQMVINNEQHNHHDDTTTVGDQMNWATWIDKGKAKETGTHQPKDIPSPRQHWYDEYKELLQGVPDAMPPYRMVNHEIPLIDLDKCLNVLQDEFDDKVNWYTHAGWWELTSASQAMPVMCVFKKDKHLCMVVDCQQHNENTAKDVTPMPD